MEFREPVAIYGKKKLTEEEYLAFEQLSLEKHEYYKGEIFALHPGGPTAMAGAFIEHNMIAGNIFSELRQRLKGQTCHPYNSDQRVYIPENTLFTYPDVSIVCGKAVTKDDDQLNLLNPSLIIEVLSASTRSYDRGDKFSLYRSIRSLTEYILIDSCAVAIEAWSVNKAGRWELKEYKKLSDELTLLNAELMIPVRDIYENTSLVVTG